MTLKINVHLSSGRPMTAPTVAFHRNSTLYPGYLRIKNKRLRLILQKASWSTSYSGRLCSFIRTVIGREPTRKQHVLKNFRTVYDAAPTASQTVGHAVGASQRFA